MTAKPDSPPQDPKEPYDGSALTPSHLPFPVVGIGGSAGALQALLRFFEALPAHPGMAFIVVLHLSPDHESNAAAILQRVTALPVRQVTARTPIEVDHVYVIAPGANLITDDGHVQPAPDSEPRRPSVAIDVFFRALADVHRERALCIVLSGTGNDGALGLARVKESGGIAFAQAPADAQHGDMPRAAIATGLVDIVLPAAELASRLVDLWNRARHDRAAEDEPPPAPAGPVAAPSDADTKESALHDILALLRSRTRHDFAHYKRATVLRRIARRMQISGQPDLTAYRDFLRHQPNETERLLQDMLISVTSFFRDPKAFDVLEAEVIAELVERSPFRNDLRVWVVGCATGEEAYSVAMLLRERAELQAEPPKMQVFASDINDKAIAAGRRAFYPGAIAADVPASRLARHFERDGGDYKVSAAVREQVLFAKHNFLVDPPFSRLDLICCRNVLIYLDRQAQAAALETFRYALKPGGFLFLGNSESVDVAANLFSPVSSEYRIFRATADAAALAKTRPPSPYSAHRPAGRPAQGAETPPRTPQEPPAAVLHEQASSRIAPPSVLIDAGYDVMHVSPGAQRYLVRSPGVPSDNLLDNVAPEVRLELRAALFKAEDSGGPAEARVVREQPDGSRSTLLLTVHAVHQAPHDARRWLVVFDESLETPPPAAGGAPADATLRLMVAKLEEENKTLKAHLQDTLDRSAVATEELKGSNEELQAINEELRSATEELETSKEELQSMNEELTTVNFELTMKVEESGRVNNDLRNLVAASNIATVFIDSALCIRRFTPQASSLFNLVASDIGRSLLDIKNRLDYEAMADDAAKVFRDLNVVERRVDSTDGRHYLARILPYRTSADKIEGAVLTFVDITDLQLAEERAQMGEERLRGAIAMSDDFAVITTDREGLVTTWNAGAQSIFGYEALEIIGQSIDRIFTEADRAAGVPDAERRGALQNGRAEDERWHQCKDGTIFFCSGVMTPLQSGSGTGFAKIARDVTRGKRRDLAKDAQMVGERRLATDARVANELKDRFLAVMSHELKQPLNLIHLNAELLTRLPETAKLPAALRIGQTIQRAVAAQTKIVNDLLDRSRVQTGKLHLSYEAVDMAEVARTLFQAVSKDAAEKNIAFSITGAASLTCHCDRVRVEQILWNLLGNAVKFTPAGGWVTIDLQREEETAKVTVSDSGIGIAKEFLSEVFGMFSQAGVQQAGATGKGGLGIGLALVDQLARAHGGRVDAASGGLGQGASFTVRLPLHRVESPPAPSAPSVTLAGGRVLLVDDDADSLEGFAMLLRLEGAVVDTASGGMAALKLLEERDYELLISDLGMPEMGGLELIAKVRSAGGSLRGLRAVAVTGYGREIDVVTALKAGFDAHVSKPVSVRRLKEALSGL